MSSMSQSLEQAISAWLRGSAMPAAPAQLYLALFRTAPTDVGSGLEIVAGNYARQAITLADDGSVTGVGTTISNSANILFPVASVAYAGPVTHWAIYDAASGGNMRLHGPWLTPKTIGIGDQYAVSAGDWASVIR